MVVPDAALLAARAAASGDWPRALDHATDEDSANYLGPGDGILHHAARLGAPASFVEAAVSRGAWRALRNPRGERPVDIALRLGRRELVDVLRPRLRRELEPAVVTRLTRHLHDIILDRADELLRRHDLRATRLPEIDPLLERSVPGMYMMVEGMYGGFTVALERTGADPLLALTSNCRVTINTQELRPPRGGSRS